MHALVPVPVSVEAAPSGEFLLTPATPILVRPADQRAIRVARFLAELIAASPSTVTEIRTGAGEPPAGSITLALAATRRWVKKATPSNYAGAGDDSRRASPAGLFYGVQTLRQLLPPSLDTAARPARSTHRRLPTGITDAPRFAWRGAMLDVSRHFFNAEAVKRYIDLLALYKLNRLHLHLADDQGWRIEITVAAEPRRASAAARRSAAGRAGTTRRRSTPTSSPMRRAVHHRRARDRHAGHTNAALASYPELNCDGVAPPLYTGHRVGFSTLCVDKDETYTFVNDVVREIAAMTPAPYFHMGGDEVEKLTHDQYLRFVERVQGIIQAHGKQMIGWGEIAPREARADNDRAALEA